MKTIFALCLTALLFGCVSCNSETDKRYGPDSCEEEQGDSERYGPDSFGSNERYGPDS